MCAFMIISRSLLRLKNVFRHKLWRKLKTHILCSVSIFNGSRAVYEIMWKHVVERDRPQMAISYGACALHDG